MLLDAGRGVGDLQVGCLDDAPPPVQPAQTEFMIFGKPIAITGGVFQIRAVGTRVTALVENGEVLLVDAGLWGSSSPILQGLETLGLVPEQIGRVVITHAHPDHSGGLGGLVAGR